MISSVSGKLSVQFENKVHLVPQHTDFCFPIRDGKQILDKNVKEMELMSKLVDI